MKSVTHVEVEPGIEIVSVHGSTMYLKNGRLHREDGPAVIYADGGQCWHKDGKLHRIDGPARFTADGSKYWYVEDYICVTNKSFQVAAGLSDEDMAVMILKYGNVH